jgi:hypothetical protein
MANIINNNFNFYKLKVYKDEYWDITLNKDMNHNSFPSSFLFYDENLIAYFDLTDKTYFTENGLFSSKKYVWDGAYSTDYALENIGYTGFDNGLIYFERDKINNKEFINLYRNLDYKISSENLNLKFHFVTGSTNQYDYDYDIVDDGIKLNGGFLQGFFRTECGKYQVFPSKFETNDALTLEFTLKPSDFEETELDRLNDIYPNNKGMFWYIGTRAENKWDYLYTERYDDITCDNYVEDYPFDEIEDDLTDFVENNQQNVQNIYNPFFDDIEEIDEIFDSDYIEHELTIDDFIFETRDGFFTLGKYEEFFDYTNPFLIFNRTDDGVDASNYEEGDYIKYIDIRNTFYEEDENNLFLLMNRTETGYTVPTIDILKTQYNEKYDVYADLFENALAFRITDDGEIGYRYLIKNCEYENRFEIVEGYSKKNMIKKDEWNHVAVKIIFTHDVMQLKFYVEENLIFISRYLPKLNLRELDDIYYKQEGVPFNMSIGGGTQGLIETILPNYMANPYRIYPLEEYFAGTFSGYINKIKIYYSNLTYNQLFNNLNYELKLME